MRIAVTGSIATDHLMTFPGSFAEQLIADQLDRVSLSFLVDGLDVRRGGVAANIAFGLGVLGLSPLLVAAAGTDFDEYKAWLERHGVDTSAVHISRTKHTARFVCTTDRDQNQLASFYPGAMSEARDIELSPIARRVGGFDLVVIGPNDPEAMMRHTEECRSEGYAFAADPSQQLARADTEMARGLIEGATYLFTNEYERTLLQQKTGWSVEEILGRVGAWVTTRGAAGATVDRQGRATLSVPAATERVKADPTGVGDAFRAGFIAGITWGLGEHRSVQLGCVLATLALEVVGTQEYELSRNDLVKRFTEAYGEDASADVARALAASPEPPQAERR